MHLWLSKSVINVVYDHQNGIIIMTDDVINFRSASREFTYHNSQRTSWRNYCFLHVPGNSIAWLWVLKLLPCGKIQEAFNSYHFFYSIFYSNAIFIWNFSRKPNKRNLEAKIILGYENFADCVFCSRGPFNLRNVQLMRYLKFQICHRLLLSIHRLLLSNLK